MTIGRTHHILASVSLIRFPACCWIRTLLFMLTIPTVYLNEKTNTMGIMHINLELLEHFTLYNLHVFLSIVVLGAYKEKNHVEGILNLFKINSA